MSGNDSRAFVFSVAISLVCHVLFFIGSIYVLGSKGDVKPFPGNSVIDISLVSLPGKVENVAKSVNKIKRKEEKKTSEAIIFKEKKSLKKKTYDKNRIKKVKIKKSLKKNTYEVARIRKSAIKNIKKRVKETKINPVEKALEQLKKEVKATEAEKSLEKKEDKVDKNVSEKYTSKKDSKSSFEHSSSIVDSVRRAPTIVEVYRVKIACQIQKNWAFSESLAGGQSDLKAELAFKVMPDGKISDVWFDTRSGNAYFDESAYKAIMKSNPVSPHPEGLNMQFVTVGIRFNLHGIW